MAGPVLLIHDDVSVIAPAKRVLQRQGIDTLLATNAADAELLFGELNPRVVVLAPDVDGGRGAAILKELRAHSRGAQIRFVLLGRPLEEAAGASVVSLPLDGHSLVREVERALESDDPAPAWHLSEPSGIEDPPAAAPPLAGLAVPAPADELPEPAPPLEPMDVVLRSEPSTEPVAAAPAREAAPPSGAALAETLFSDFADPDLGNPSVPLDALFGDWAAAASKPREPPAEGSAAEAPVEPALAPLLLDLSGPPDESAPAHGPRGPEALEDVALPHEAEAIAPRQEALAHRAEAQALSDIEESAEAELLDLRRMRERAEAKAREAGAALERERTAWTRASESSAAHQRAAEEARRAAEAIRGELRSVEQGRADREGELADLRAALEERRRALDSAERQKAEAQGLLSRASDQARSLAEEARALSDELAALSQRNETAQAEARALGARIETEKGALAEALALAEQRSAERDGAAKARQVAEAKAAQAEAERDRLEAESRALAERAAAARRAIEALRAQLGPEEEALQREREAQERALEELRARGGSERARLEALRASSTEEEARHVELCRRLEGQLAELARSIEEQRLRAQELSRELAAESERGARLSAEEEEARARLAEAQASSRAALQRLEALRAEAALEALALQAMEQDERAARGQRTELERALQASRERGAEALSAVEALREQLSREQRTAQETQALASDLQARLLAAADRERERAEGQRSELAGMEAALGEVQRLADDLERRRAQTSERAREVEARVEAAKAELASREAALARELSSAEDSERRARELGPKLAEAQERAKGAESALEAQRAALAEEQAKVEAAARQAAELSESLAHARERAQAEFQQLEARRASAAAQQAALVEERQALEAREREQAAALERAREALGAAQGSLEEQRALFEQEEARACELAASEREARERAEAARRVLREREEQVRKDLEERRLEQEAIRRREAEASAIPEARLRAVRSLMALRSAQVDGEKAELKAREPTLQLAQGRGEEGFKSEAPPPPTAPPFAQRGTLAQLGAPALLCRAFEARLTGRIDVSGPDAQRTLWFEEGRAVAAASSSPVERLEEIALRAALITRAQHHALRTCEEKQARRLALQMVELGYLRASEMVPLVRRRVLEIAFSLFLDEESAYVFTAESPPAEERVVLPMHPYALVAEGIRRKLSPDRLWERLGGPGTLLRPREKGVDLDYFGLSARERRLAAKVDGLRTVEELLFEGGLDEPAALKVLWALVAAGNLEIAVLGQAVGPRNPAEAARVEVTRVNEKYGQILTGDYFQILGLRRDASGYEVRESYERLAREFHPDRFLGLEDAILLSRLEEIGRALAEAVDVLADDAVRDEYSRNLVE
jgi:chromosome segregation ATPase